MAVKKAPEKFVTSDGRKFDTEKEAKRHDALATAREKFEEARRALNQALALTQRTADGELFEFGVFRDYYYVTPGWWSVPQLKEVHFLGWGFEIREHDEAVEISVEENEDANHRHVSYAVKNLYYHKRNAQVALITAQEEWLTERAKEIATHKESLIGKPSS